jgi:hypothetical protein
MGGSKAMYFGRQEDLLTELALRVLIWVRRGAQREGEGADITQTAMMMDCSFRALSRQ